MKPVALLVCGVVLALVVADGASADDQDCGQKARAWAASCAATTTGGRIEVDRCPAGHLIFSVVTDEAARVFVDATSDSSGLRQIQGVGLSPIGNFDDFRTAPRPVQDAFDRVVRCVERDPALPFAKHLGMPATAGTRTAPARWRVLVAVFVGLLVAGLAVARKRRSRRPRTG